MTFKGVCPVGCDRHLNSGNLIERQISLSYCSLRGASTGPCEIWHGQVFWTVLVVLLHWSFDPKYMRPLVLAMEGLRNNYKN